MITCPNCHRGNPGEALSCQFCGAELTPLASSEGLKKELNSLKLEINRLMTRVKEYEDKQQHHQSLLFDYIDRLFHPEKQPSDISPEQSSSESTPARQSSSASLDSPVSAKSKKEYSLDLSPVTQEGLDDSWKNIIHKPVSNPSFRGSKAPEAILLRDKAATSPGTEVQFGQKWLLIIGVITVIFGVGYFVKYSFDQNWVDPSERVLLAYLGGTAFLGVGEFFRRKKLTRFGLNMMGAGIGIFYVATYTAFNLYNLMDQMTAFGTMVVITVFACGLALFYDTVGLSVLGAVGGFLTPFLVGHQTDRMENLMTYVAILNVGLLALSFYKKWDILQYLGFVFTWVIYSIWHANSYRPDQFWPALCFVNLFFLIYAFMPFTYFFLKKREESMGGMPVSFLNSIIAFGFDYAIVTGLYSREYLSAITFSYAALFIFMARYLRKRNEKNLEPYVLLLSKGIFFLTLSFPLLLSKQWVTLFWGIQAIVLFGVANKIKKGLLVGWALTIYFLTIFKFYFYDWYAFGFNWDKLAYQPDYWSSFAERWITLFFVLAMLWFGSWFMDKLSGWYKAQGDWNLACKAAFAFCLFVSLNMEVGAFCYQYAPNARFAIISVLWALYSVGLMIVGFAQSSAPLRKIAIGLFFMTLLKVFLFDMRDVSTPYRVLSFIGLGLLLIGASYLYYRFEKELTTEG